MRNTKINIHGTSQKERIKLYDHLIALGEPIYNSTKLRDTEYEYSLFDYSYDAKRWSGGNGGNTKNTLSIDEFIEKYPVTTQESEKDYAIIYIDSSLEDRKLVHSHLQSLNYKIYAGTGFISDKVTGIHSEQVFVYEDEKWILNNKYNIATYIKLISVKDFIAKFIKTSKQSLIEQDSSVQIGQKYKNSNGNINIITRVTSTNVAYKPEYGTKEYSCTVANVKKNWKLLPEDEITSTTTSCQIIKKDKYEVGAKVKIREDLRYHHNSTYEMCKLAGTVVTITESGNFEYKFKNSGTYHWTRGMFEGEVIEPQIEQQQTVSSKDPFEGDTSTTITSKYPIGFMFSIDCAHKPRVLKVIEIKQNTVRGTNYNLQYVDTGTTTGFVSESFIDNEVASTTLATVPIKEATLVVSSAASAVSIKKFDGVTGTPLGGTNQPTIKREKKSMAKAIKETAIVTLDQNKQAAIIAGKMEAGRILNKQVIKQIKPHIPMFVRGYLDTPLAPVIVANLVAAIGNHTQNRRVQQVSELMLLAAADTTVQSFNLDKIIDDVLAGVKLPAGILTSDEE